MDEIKIENLSSEDMNLAEQEHSATSVVLDKTFVNKKKKIGSFVPKEAFLGKKVKVVLGDVCLNYQFNKERLQIHVEADNISGWVDVNDTNNGFLVDSFGSDVTQYKGKLIYISGQPFEKEGMTSGITLIFSRN